MSTLLLYSGECAAGTAAVVRGRIASAPVTALVPAPLRDDLTLAATELLTNAVRAGAHRVDVAIEAAEGHIELLVTDDAPGVPERQNPGPFDTHGRGLRILDAVAAQWGHQPTEPGKTVWARFAMS